MLAKLADIRPGEGRQVARASLLLFALIAGHTLLETTRDTLFLGELPVRNLTIVYACLAGLALVAVRLNRALLTRFGQRSALLLTLVGSAYGAIVFYLLPLERTAIFSLYLYSGLFGSVAIVQFWMLTNRWFTVAQGKRLFGLVSAGGVLGAVGGASLAIAVLEMLPVRQLLLLAAGCFMLGAILLTSVHDEVQLPRARRPMVELRALKLLRQQPYLLGLAGLLAISTSALLITDYLFKSVAARSFEAAELGRFFAVYYAVLNGVALMVQLVVSGYLVRRLGVIAAFLVLPLLLLGGAAAVATLGGVLLLVLVTKGADGGLRHSLHRVTSELLWMPLPEDIRNSAKSFADTVVVRGAQALTAGALLFLASRAWDDPRTLALVLGGLLITWLAVGLSLKKPYLGVFREALARNDRGVARLDLDLNAVEVVVEALSSREPARAIAAIELLASNGRSRLIPALVLYHESEQVLVAALDAIASPDRKDWVPLGKRLLDHPSERVRVAAMRALSAAGLAGAAEERMHDVSPEVRGHAAFLLADRTRSVPPERHPAVREVLAIAGPQGAVARRGLLDSVAALADRRYTELLLELGRELDDTVVLAAAAAMTRLHDPRFVTPLVKRLAWREGRQAVREALVEHGAVALDQLEALLLDSRTDANLRRHIPLTIAGFGTQRAADILVNQLGRETHAQVRYKLLKSLTSLVKAHPVHVDRVAIEHELKGALSEHLTLAWYLECFEHVAETTVSPKRGLLLELLHDKAETALDWAFQLLNVLHKNEDIRSVAAAMRSEDRKTRAHALEYLDALALEATLPGVRQLLSVVADDLPIAQKVKRVRGELGDLPADRRQAFVSLMREADATLAAIAACYALEVDGQALAADIARLTQGSHVSTFDAELVRSLGQRREASLVR